MNTTEIIVIWEFDADDKFHAMWFTRLANWYFRYHLILISSASVISIMKIKKSYFFIHSSHRLIAILFDRCGAFLALEAIY